MCIEFKRWGAGPDREDLTRVNWPAVPRIGEYVWLPTEAVAGFFGEVCKVEWTVSEDLTCIVVVWLR